MKIQFWSIGKANESHVEEGIQLFTKRITNYYPVQWQIISTPKNAAVMSEVDLKQKEGETILGLLKKKTTWYC